MDLTTIDPVWWIVLGVLLALLIGLLIWSARRKAHHTQQLKSQFRSEYDRTASSASRKETEEDLERRAARRSRVSLVELEGSDAESLQQHLEELLRSFVDGPQGAALGMTQLVERVAGARGYVATEGSVIDLVSVDHPEQVAAMRRSEAVMQRAQGADLTEASRQTFLDARVLAERLLAEGRAGHIDEEEPSPAPRQRQSEIAAPAPAPPMMQDEPQATEPNWGTDTGSSAVRRATDGPQTGPTGDEPPRRR